MVQRRHRRYNLAVLHFLHFPSKILEVLHVVRLYSRWHICSSQLIKGPFILGLDLLELVWCHVVLEKVEVLVAVFAEVKYMLVFLRVDNRLDVEPLSGVEFYEPLVLLVEDNEEDVLVTLGRELDALLQDTSLTFIIGYAVLFLHEFIIMQRFL